MPLDVIKDVKVILIGVYLVWFGFLAR